MAVNQNTYGRRVRVFTLVLLMVIYHGAVQSCSQPKGWSIQSARKRASNADIVIIGKVTQTHASRETKGHYDARFQVVCTLKGEQLPPFVNVSAFGFVSGHCVNSRALFNHTYIVFLRKRKSSYVVAEINMQPGTIPFRLHLARKLVHKLRSRNCSRHSLMGEEEKLREVKQLFDQKKMTRAPKTRASVTERTLITENNGEISNTALKERPPGSLLLLLLYCLYYLST